MKSNWQIWLTPGLGFKRWLGLLLLGLLLLALGITYLLTHVYRQQPFPPAAYYLTLQFIPRWARGLLFIALGMVVVAVSLNRLSDVIVGALAPGRQDEGLAELVYRRRQEELGQRVVLLGGSTGLSHVVQGLRDQRPGLHLSVIPGLLDNGRFAARLREVHGLPEDHILFPTLEDVGVYAELADGTLLAGEAEISGPQGANLAGRAPIERVFLGQPVKRTRVWEDSEAPPESSRPAPYHPPVRSGVIEALRRAEAIVIGPGCLYTGIIPILEIPEVGAAIRESEGKRIFICNLMTETGKTEEYTVADHLQAIRRQSGLEMDYVVMNSAPLRPEMLAKYQAEGAQPVRHVPDSADAISRVTFAETGEETTLVEGAILVSEDLLTETRQEVTISVEGEEITKHLLVVRHDPDRLARVLDRLLREE